MAEFGNSMRIRYIPVHFNGNEIHLVGVRAKTMFPPTMVVIDDDMSDDYYLEINFKKATPKHTRGMLLTVTDVMLYNQAGDVMDYYWWDPEQTKGAWNCD